MTGPPVGPGGPPPGPGGPPGWWGPGPPAGARPVPGFPPPGPYPPPPPYSSPPAGFGPGEQLPRPRKSRTGLVITLALVAALVLGVGGIALVVALNGDDDTDLGDPRAVAEEFVDRVFRASTDGALTPGDLDALVCERDMPELRASYQEFQESEPGESEGTGGSDPAPEIDYRVVDLTTDGDSGAFAVEQQGLAGPVDVAPFELLREDGDWQVCGVSPP